MGWYKEYLQDLKDIESENTKQAGCGCLLFLVGAIIFGFCSGGEDDDSNKNVNAEVVQNEAQTKTNTSSYLQGVDDISSSEDLYVFYYKIADKFKKNRMGLKGDADQIEAGNKLMSNLYDFLGTSAKEGLLDVDSMKTIIQSNTIVSEYRKKKALQELNMGIEKINSLEE